MATVTLLFRNGKTLDFETANCKITSTKHDKTTGTNIITDMEWFKKDNGLSLLFVDYSEIICVIRDTKKQEDY